MQKVMNFRKFNMNIRLFISINQRHLLALDSANKAVAKLQCERDPNGLNGVATIHDDEFLAKTNIQSWSKYFGQVTKLHYFGL